MDLGLSDRVYVVTGASRGLGRACAELLAAEGARLVLNGRDEDALGRRPPSSAGRSGRSRVPGDLGEPGHRDLPRGRRRRPLRPARRRADQRRRPAAGHRDGPRRRAPGGRRSRASSSARCGWRGTVGKLAVARGRVDPVRALDVGAHTRSPAWRCRTACGPASRWPPRRWPTSSAGATCGSTASCPAGSTPTGSRELDDADRPRRGGPARSTRPRIPLAPLRRAAGVRPARGVPALPRRQLRHRHGARRRRRDDPRALSAGPQATRRPVPVLPALAGRGRACSANWVRYRSA